jgi:hypothetical protein
MFSYEEVDEPDCTQKHVEDMPLPDKILMWIRNAGQDYPMQLNDDLFEGVKDEDDSIDQNETSGYYNIIVNSPAYKWFLTSLEKESTLQLETPHPRIRQQILDKLPNRNISKKRNPDIYEVIFDLQWDYLMTEKLQYVLSEDTRSLTQSYRPPIVITGSPREAQVLTIQQYLAQTWPLTGLQFLNALGKGIKFSSYGMSGTPQGFVHHAY